MNILNVSDIERELTKTSAKAVHPAAARWVKTVARNYILGKLSEKDIDSNFRVYNPKEKLDPFMPAPSLLPAWAAQALERNEVLHWFDRVQARRRNLWQTLNMIVYWFNTFKPQDTRLRRIDRINFDTAAKAGALWFKDISENIWHYIKDKPPVVLECENGFRWVRLTTSLHFEREGHLMGHCVGNGCYFDAWQQHRSAFYSLRDKNNIPHVTMEVRLNTDKSGADQGELTQCKGNRNSRPAAAYQPHIRRFINEMRLSITGDRHYIDNAPLEN